MTLVKQTKQANLFLKWARAKTSSMTQKVRRVLQPVALIKATIRNRLHTLFLMLNHRLKTTPSLPKSTQRRTRVRKSSPLSLRMANHTVTAVAAVPVMIKITETKCMPTPHKKKTTPARKKTTRRQRSICGRISLFRRLHRNFRTLSSTKVRWPLNQNHGATRPKSGSVSARNLVMLRRRKRSCHPRF